MLLTLSIRDFVIIDTLELELSSGFTVLTGETGAGKSILIDALGLILGGRADASMVREGANKADVSALFAPNADTRAWLQTQDFDSDDDELLIRRTIDQNGRSKAYINGNPASATQLRELGEWLIDIHGQHAYQSLLRGDAQRQLLDAQGHLGVSVKIVAENFQTWRKLRQQRETFERDAKNVLQEKERLEWQVGELEKLAPKASEWEQISQEQSRLAHAASLLEGVREAADAISECDHPIDRQLTVLLQKLRKLQQYDPALQPICDALDSATIHLQECDHALSEYLSRTELDPERLREVEQRVEALHTAARRLHVAPEQLPQEWSRLREQLAQLSDAADIDGLKTQEAAALQAYLQPSKELSAARQQVAEKLSKAVTQAMQELSMAGGSFSVVLHSGEPAAHGLEQIEFMVAGHAGVQQRPLAKVASGGELARISLAIAVITASATSTPTMIFDEVDSGIGGAVAEVVGKLLKRLGQDRQVLCVTHLPQVASQANQHLQVSKTQTDGQTLSSIDPLDSKARVEEIARMLGGVEITATTRKHARELLAS